MIITTKKRYMFLMILLTALQLDIAQAITKVACSDLPESSIIEKLENVEKFELIDDEKSFYYDAFYEAEILHSTYKGTKDGRKIINFVIKPAPLITFSEAVAKKIYPDFYASCGFDTAKKYSCYKVTDYGKGVNSFNITFTIRDQHQQCRGDQSELVFTYNINVDEGHYQEIVRQVKATPEGNLLSQIKNLNDKNAFFNNYFDDFFSAFEARSFEDWSK
ncbi:MAG: hypothetical protein KDK51_06135 [Deltaproteobacteria bacterium]|nr:hypothetical protein [Deltaproteobacteria bacterium]